MLAVTVYPVYVHRHCLLALDLTVTLTPFEWFKVACTIIAAVGSLAVFFWGRDRAVAINEAESGRDIRDLHRRIDKADGLSSRLSSYVQGLPTRADFDKLQADATRIHIAQDDHIARLSDVAARLDVRAAHLERRANIVEERLARWPWRRSDETIGGGG